MGSRDYPSTLHKCVTKACIYSVQFFETKAEVENRMTRGGCFRSCWLISVNCSSDWIHFFIFSIISHNDLFDWKITGQRPFANSW
jgi:hypothetical protein